MNKPDVKGAAAKAASLLKKKTTTTGTFIAFICLTVVGIIIQMIGFDPVTSSIIMNVASIVLYSVLQGKKLGFDEGLAMFKEILQRTKEEFPNDPEKVLTKLEIIIMFAVKFWNRAKDALEDIFFNKDGKRDGIKEKA